MSGYSGDGGLATAALLNQPNGLVIDSLGNLFIADAVNNAIRKVDALTGIITTVCGNGTAGFSGDGGLASSAVLNIPDDIKFDLHGNFYISSYNDARIRKINTSGIISTFAGTGINGYTGDGGSATSAEIFNTSLCIDSAGNVFISDEYNSVIRKIDTNGIISHYAGDSGIYMYNGEGIPCLTAHIDPNWLAIDSRGLVYLTDPYNNRVRMIDGLGNIRTVAGNGIYGISGDGGVADSAEFGSIGGLAFDKCGNLYISQVDYPARIRKVTFDSTCHPYGHGPTTATPTIKTVSNTISIYPNPANTEITVNAGEAIRQLTISNTVGQVVYGGSYNASTATVNVANLPKGLYVVKVNERWVGKMVKE